MGEATPFWLRRSKREYAAAAILFVPACVVLWSIFRTATRDWWPVGDNAATWLRSWDVGTRHSPLVGPHSRLGFHHPGPMMFYLLAVPLRLLRGNPSALLAGGLVIAFASAVGVVLFSRRAGRGTTLVLSIAMAILAIGHGDRLIEPWNPFLIVLPFALFLVTAWFASAGEPGAALVATVAGTLAAQSHLGALPPVAIIGTTALVLRVARPPPGATRFPSRKHSLGIGAAIAFLWAPPAVEQLKAAGRNASRIFLYFGKHGPDPRVGWKNALPLTGTELHPWGPWTGQEQHGFVGEVFPGPAWALPAVLLLLGVALVLALRFRDDLGTRLVVVAGAAVVACAAAIANVRGIPFHYLLSWSRPIAMLAVAAPLIVLARRIPPAAGAKLGDGVEGTAIALSIVALPIAVCALRAEVPISLWSHIHAEMKIPAISATPPGSTLRVAAIGPFYTGSPEALAIALELSGRKAMMMPWYAPAVGKHRTAEGQVKLPTLVLATGVAVERVPHRDKARTLFERDRLGSTKRAAIIARRKKLEEAFISAGRRDSLLEPLDASVPWLWLHVPKGVNEGELNRFLKDTIGEDRIPVALFSLPPVTW